MDKVGRWLKLETGNNVERSPGMVQEMYFPQIDLIPLFFFLFRSWFLEKSEEWKIEGFENKFEANRFNRSWKWNYDVSLTAVKFV